MSISIKILKLFLCSLLIILSSCAGDKDEEDLEVSITPSEGTIINYDMETCNSLEQNSDAINPTRKYVTGPIVYFLKLSLTWKKNYRLFIQEVNLQFDNDKFTINCSIPTNELASLFLFSSLVTTGTALTTEQTKIAANKIVYDAEGFTSAGTVTSYSGCKIACPVTLKDKNDLEVSGSGTLTVRGTSEKEDVFERVKTNISISIVP